jgi:hypothetical protein
LLPGKFLAATPGLAVGAKLRIFLNAKFHPVTGKASFFLTRYEVPDSKPSCSAPTNDPKKFLRR